MPKVRSADSAERRLSAQLAAYAKHSVHDAVESTEAARRAGPGNLEYWLKKVDPDGTLQPADRARRASAAQKGFYTRLALASVKARRQASA